MNNDVIRAKGPRLNNRSLRPTNRDNLGITSAQTTLQDELCPVVNTVTYRAFYWPFLVWNYYNYINSHSIEEISKGKDSQKDFNKNCVKRNDYYFILGCLMNNEAEHQNLAGVENGLAALKDYPDGPYEYNEDYLKATFGGMQYYGGGVLTLGFVTNHEQDGTVIPGLARLTESIGRPMGEAFDKVISNTRYYKEYRHSEKSVPIEVVKELGDVIRMDMKGLEECKMLLKAAFFGEHDNQRYSSKNLIKSRDYLIYLYDNYDIKEKPDNKKLRYILYDWFSPRGGCEYDYPEDLEEIIKGWETVVGRQYFTTSIEVICKAMLNNLEYPKSFDQIVEDTVNNSNWDTVKLLDPVSKYINSSYISFENREDLLFTGARDMRTSCENALRVLFSVYDRFKDRCDIPDKNLRYGMPVSVEDFIKKIDEMRDKSVCDFLRYIMKRWIIDQNEMVGFEKLLQGRDGYIFERVDELYRSTGKEPAAGFQEIRLINLYQIIKDLDYIK